MSASFRFIHYLCSIVKYNTGLCFCSSIQNECIFFFVMYLQHNDNTPHMTPKMNHIKQIWLNSYVYLFIFVYHLYFWPFHPQNPTLLVKPLHTFTIWPNVCAPLTITPLYSSSPFGAQVSRKWLCVLQQYNQTSLKPEPYFLNFSVEASCLSS